MLAGDVLTAVDGTSVPEISLTEVKNMVKGKEGTDVTLTFLRGETEKDFTVEPRAFSVVPAQRANAGRQCGLYPDRQL